MPKFNYSALKLGLLLISGLPLIANAATDKLKWDGNNHFYQEIYQYGITWPTANTNCAKAGGHLATITSDLEQAFIIQNMLSSSTGSYALGATYNPNNATWSWLTGEKWSYTHWDSYEPENISGKNYLVISDFDQEWYNRYATDKLYGYICEWSYAKFIASTTLPTIGGTTNPEIAALYQDKNATNYYVRFNDASSGQSVRSDLAFGKTANDKPIAIAALKDISGNGKPEVAVLSFRYNSSAPTVMIKDSINGTTLNTITFLPSSTTVGAYDAIDFSIVDDMNGNGTPEISVMATRAGTTMVQIRDSSPSVKGVIKQFAL